MQITTSQRLIILMDEISIAKSKLMPEDTGHIHTSISYLESRVDEVQKQRFYRLLNRIILLAYTEYYFVKQVSLSLNIISYQRQNHLR